ncbi:MAG: HDOD domain-containing protein [Desulfohalobiaceae bacterium]
MTNQDDSSSHQPQSQICESIHVARQPVFNTDMCVWGYELLFRHSAQSTQSKFLDGEAATSQVIVDGFSMATEWISAKQKVLINYPASLLVQGIPRALPSDMAVVEILETVYPEKEVLKMCRQLKSEGYSLALDDFVGDPGYEPFLELADLIKVDVLHLSRDNLNHLAQDLKRHSAALLAEKVEDLETFDHCRELGFDLFQGFFFSRPQTVSDKKLSSNQLTKLNLLQELGKPELEVSRITQIIQEDVSLSYRLLRYINSPGMGLAFTVKSIAQAVNLLGSKRITVWLRVLVMADMNHSPQAQELLFISLQRAWMLDIIAREQKSDYLEPDTMFLLGLFSSLDTILSLPMKQIVGKLSLEPELADTLLGKNTELGLWLGLAMASERGNWEEVDSRLEKAGISRKDLAWAQNQAATWSKEVLVGEG